MRSCVAILRSSSSSSCCFSFSLSLFLSSLFHHLSHLLSHFIPHFSCFLNQSLLCFVAVVDEPFVERIPEQVEKKRMEERRRRMEKRRKKRNESERRRRRAREVETRDVEVGKGTRQSDGGVDLERERNLVHSFSLPLSSSSSSSSSSCREPSFVSHQSFQFRSNVFYTSLSSCLLAFHWVEDGLGTDGLGERKGWTTGNGRRKERGRGRREERGGREAGTEDRSC